MGITINAGVTLGHGITFSAAAAGGGGGGGDIVFTKGVDYETSAALGYMGPIQWNPKYYLGFEGYVGATVNFELDSGTYYCAIGPSGELTNPTNIPIFTYSVPLTVTIVNGASYPGTTYTFNTGLGHPTADWTDGFFYSEPSQNHISLNTGLAEPAFYNALAATPSGTVFYVVYTDNGYDTLTQTGSSSYFGSQLNIPVSGFSTGTMKNIRAITF